MNHLTAKRLTLAAVFALAAARPASADEKISVYAGPQIVMQSTGADAILAQLGAGFDFGPKTIVPIRLRADVSDAFGGSGGLVDNIFSAGVTARLTTPLYFGAGVSVDSFHLPYAFGVGGPASIPFGGGPVVDTTDATGIGSQFFVGQKIVSAAGFGLNLEASYRFYPSTYQTANSGVGFGFRGSF